MASKSSSYKTGMAIGGMGRQHFREMRTAMLPTPESVENYLDLVPSAPVDTFILEGWPCAHRHRHILSCHFAIAW